MGDFKGNDRKFRERREGGGRRFDKDHSPRFDSHRGQVELTDAICDKCGKYCKLPFTPTKGKPIYCRDCFKKPGEVRNKDTANSSQLEQINRKLDRIMEALNLRD